MPWDGNGNFILNQNFPADRDAGPPASYIQADLMDNELQNIRVGLDNCRTLDGQNVPSGDLPMGTHKHTNTGVATTATDYAQAGQVQKGALVYLTSVGGTADAITATAALSMASLTTGFHFIFIPGADNTTTTPTININSIGAKTFKKHGGDALVAGDLQQNKPALGFWNGTYAELMNPYTVAKAQFNDFVPGTAAVRNLGADIVANANGDLTRTLSVNQKTADYTAVVGDNGTEINFSLSSASKTLTLNAASTYSNGYMIDVSNSAGSTFALTISSASTFAGNGLASGTSFVLKPGESCRISYFAATFFLVTSLIRKSSVVQGGFKALKIVTADGGTGAVVTADQIALQNTSGEAVLVSSVNATAAIDTGSIASATWYYVWVFYNPTTLAVSAKYSLSSTSPTAPSGSTYSARVGAVRTKSGSAVFLGTLQYGRKAQYTNPPLPAMATASGSVGSVTSPTWIAVPVAAYVPTTASEVTVVVNDNGGVTIVAPNNSYGASNSNTNAPPSNQYGSGGNLTATSTFVIESANIYWATQNSGSGIFCLGWEDNL